MAFLTWIKANAAPLTRIGLRYAASYGLFVGWASDQQIVVMVSGLLIAIVETVYAVAKRKGWTT